MHKVTENSIKKYILVERKTLIILEKKWSSLNNIVNEKKNPIILVGIQI